MHGFNQGSPAFKELIATIQPEVIMVLEHRFTTDNLSKLNAQPDDYFVFGSSAMNDCVNAGPLVGTGPLVALLMLSVKNVSL